MSIRRSKRISPLKPPSGWLGSSTPPNPHPGMSPYPGNSSLDTPRLTPATGPPQGHPTGHTWDRAQRAKQMAEARDAMHAAGATSKAAPPKPRNPITEECGDCCRLQSILAATGQKQENGGLQFTRTSQSHTQGTGQKAPYPISGMPSRTSPPRARPGTTMAVLPTAKPGNQAQSPIGARSNLPGPTGWYNSLYNREPGTLRQVNSLNRTTGPPPVEGPGSRAPYLPLPWETGFFFHGPPFYQYQGIPGADTARQEALIQTPPVRPTRRN